MPKSLKWLGHMSMMDNESSARKFILSHPVGNRATNRDKWKDQGSLPSITKMMINAAIMLQTTMKVPFAAS